MVLVDYIGTFLTNCKTFVTIL